MSALDPLFAEAFGDAAARRNCLDQPIRLTLLNVVFGRTHPFATAIQPALEVTAQRRGTRLGEKNVNR